jgi:hypothetical protein
MIEMKTFILSISLQEKNPRLILHIFSVNK